MNNDDKPAADNPVAPQATLEPPAPPPSAPVEPRRRNWALGIAWLALLIGIGAGVTGYYTARHLGALQQSQGQQLIEIGAALQSARQREDELTVRLAQVENEVPGIGAELARVEELLRRDAQQRIEPADVERLLRMANDSLQLEGDSETALLALRNADQRLQALADPLFAEVRRRLAQEITALAAVPQPDIAGMAYTLGSLQGELGKLSLKRGAPLQPGGSPAEAAADIAELPRWRALLRDMWAELKTLVVVRQRAGNEPPMLTPDEQVFLNQNLHLKLEAARLALLGRDNRNFHASLDTAQNWLHEYYDADSAPVAAVSVRIRELQQVDIAPPLPDISNSLHALQTALERRRGSVRDGAATRPPGGNPTPVDREGGGA